jgi:hypothetical protein
LSHVDCPDNRQSSQKLESCEGGLSNQQKRHQYAWQRQEPPRRCCHRHFSPLHVVQALCQPAGLGIVVPGRDGAGWPHLSGDNGKTLATTRSDRDDVQLVE